MMFFATLARLVSDDGIAGLVTVVAAAGSTPREAGARMVVSRQGAIAGTIGGGRLELEAVDMAGRMMQSPVDAAHLRRAALGPELGQCCGGAVTLLVETYTSERLPELRRLAQAEAAGPFSTLAHVEPGRAPERVVTGPGNGPARAELDADGVLAETFGRWRRRLFLFGAGHVGRALVLALAPLPFETLWIDARADQFPDRIAGHVRTLALTRPETALDQVMAEDFVVIMTHDHASDLAILAAALERRPAYLGMIGSMTKRARFESRLRSMGVPAPAACGFRCPIGIAGITSKEPALIALAVAADLAVADEAAAAVRESGRRKQSA